ncbi:MAG TPA: OmpP1/FadL family transporter [Syntrophales bacterium]|nr:OmpP1/FadL family transporter [Syntrophales bacterium]
MKRRDLIRVISLFVYLVSVLTGASAQAGGIMLYELGTNDVGLAAAGYAARAQDAATVFTNPAGMSRLDKSQVLGGLQALYGNVHFAPNASTTTTGGDGGNAVNWLPGGSLFVVEKINQDWSVGFGVLSYFGLSTTYDDSWVGRYYIQKGTLIGLTLTPAVSYRVNEKLYLGAGVNIMYGYLDSQIAVNNLIGPDGQMKLNDNRWGYGANLGILVEPWQGTRFGLTYLSEVKLDFGAQPQFSGLATGLHDLLNQRGLLTGNIDMSMKVPQMVMFSAYHELSRQWAVMGNVGWQNWSQFGKVDVQVNSNDPTSLTVNNDYNDTWHAALGVQYHTLETPWTYSAGIAYDSSAVDDNKRTVTLPMGAVWRFGLGAQYAFSPALSLGAAYELAWGANMPVDQNRGPAAGRVAGSYNNTSFSFFALNLSWKF